MQGLEMLERRIVEAQVAHEAALELTAIARERAVEEEERPRGNCGDVVLVDLLANDAAVCDRPRGHDGRHGYGDLEWEHAYGTVLFTVMAARCTARRKDGTQPVVCREPDGHAGRHRMGCYSWDDDGPLHLAMG